MFPTDLFPSGHPTEGVDGTVLFFGLTDDAEGGVLGVLAPQRAATDPKSIQIGFTTLVLDATDSLSSMLHQPDGDGATPITATVATSDGDCIVRNSGALEPLPITCPSEPTAERLRQTATLGG